MGSEWSFVRLGDFCSKIGSGATPKGGSSVYLDEGEISLIRSQNVYNNGFSESGLVYITSSAADKLKNVIVEPNDILLNITGDSVARVCMVDESYLPARVNQHVAIIRVDPKEFDSRFVRYFLSTEYTQSLLLTLASAGATRNALTKSMIEDFLVPKPPLERQVAIADSLAALDNKIALNRQINTTLESMAQALFKSWFVDFDPVIDNALAAGNEIPDALQKRAARREALRQQTNKTTGATDAASSEQAVPETGLSDQRLPPEVQQLFPDRFVLTEEMGWVPEGWEVKPLSDVVSDIVDHRGKTPKKLGGDWVETGYPAISAKNIKSGKLIRPDAIRFIDEELYRKWMKVPLSKGDILLTSEAPLGEMYFLAEEKEYVLSQRLFGIRANSDYISGCYLYFWLDSPLAKSDLETRATGTTVVGIRQAELQKVLVLSPGKALSDEFSKLALGWMERANMSEQQITVLSDLRDSLLPKLLSGQITIPDAEQQLAEVL